jgi:predicted nucleotide-binding protein
MFMGRLKRFRSLIVQPRGVDLKIPSDLLGITPLDIDLPAGADIKVAVTPACDTVRELVRKHGPI